MGHAGRGAGLLRDHALLSAGFAHDRFSFASLYFAAMPRTGTHSVRQILRDPLGLEHVAQDPVRTATDLNCGRWTTCTSTAQKKKHSAWPNVSGVQHPRLAAQIHDVISRR
jgi:mitochondrial fission protein ELM1